MTPTSLLVEPEWLHENLGDPSLRIIDVTVELKFDPETGDTAVQSGWELWSKSHVPGAAFADLIEITPDNRLPSPELFADAMSELGIGSETHVVVYDYGMGLWATRMWWLLRLFGFDAVAVLDGGWNVWNDDQRPISTEPSSYSAACFQPHFRPEFLASTEEVQAIVDSGGSTCLVNALAPEMFRGEQLIGYTRPGRIPGSVNVPYYSLLDPATGRFLKPKQLREHFGQAGVREDGRQIVTYCGGGIAATMDAFGLALLGHENVAVYDGALAEWTADPARPLEVG